MATNGVGKRVPRTGVRRPAPWRQRPSGHWRRRALAAQGIGARAIGSLDREDFREDSDVDILADCGRDRLTEVLTACGMAFGDFPFDVVLRDELAPGVADAMLAEASCLVPFASVRRRIEVMATNLGDLRGAVAEIEAALSTEGDDSRRVRMWRGLADDLARELTDKLAKLLRRVVLDGVGEVPPGASPAATFKAAAAATDAAVSPATATLLAALDPLTDDWPRPRRDLDAVLDNARATIHAAEATVGDIEAYLDDHAPRRTVATAHP